jgi:uncharacterized protein (DUF885 family)
MYMKKSLLSMALFSALAGQVHAHEGRNEQIAANASSVAKPSAQPSTQSNQGVQTESQRANQLFDDIFMANVMASPVAQTFQGIKQDYDKWDDLSDSAVDKQLKRTKQQLSQLTQLNVTLLDEQTKLSYTLLKENLQQSISDDKWRYHNYPVNQMYGQHTMLASLLVNQHQVSDVNDAKAYISRLNGIPKALTQLKASLELRAQKHIIAPKFVFPYAISDSRNIITGAPFDDVKKQSVLWADINRKVAALTISDKVKQALLAEARTSLLTQVAPAYKDFMVYIDTLAARADDRDGVWKFPQGEAFYNNALARTTTTDMSSDQIHQLGLSEVARIHNEMKGIMKQVDFKGSLAEFFVFMRDDEQFYFPGTAEGKADYLAQSSDYIDTMTSRLDEVFNIKPKAKLTVKAVEAFREQSAGKAFYEQPAPDGSRPGTFYANLYDMKSMPKYQMEALAYHEGIPGHHMQIAISQELTSIPKFRKFGSYTAYVEGWGLYTEYFPKEMGMYADPYSDFGRLSMELWRACRLVVDTGIHSQKWTREQGIAYYMDNTPNAELDAIKMVERHIIMPSQATAYKVGMIKILQLRAKAKSQLGDEFSLGEFHTLVLKNGPLPLTVLEQQVDLWIKTKQS